MSESRLERPPQVTMAVGIGLIGCLIFVLALLESMGATYSIEARKRVTELLASPTYDWLGLSVDEMLRLVRVGIYGMGVAGAIGFVLSFYVYQRNNAARIGFTVAAVCLVPALAGPTMLGVTAIVVTFAAFGLWSQPARDWFAGRVPQPVVQQRQPPRPPLARDLSAQQPPPSSYAFGAPRPMGETLASYPPPNQPPPMPGAVMLAVRITRVTTVMAAVLLLSALTRVASDRAGFDREVEKTVKDSSSFLASDVDPSTVWPMTLVLIGLLVLWCVGAFWLTYFVTRRAEWARILLVISSALAALGSLVMIVAIVTVLPLIAALVTLRLLLNKDVAAWFTWRPPLPR